jgi:F-type H+-transporting ATPase subunit b
MANAHPTETVAHTEASGGHEAGEATVAGIFGPGFFVALAMLMVFALAIWKKVPSAIGKSLDKKIALIREQLDEAKALRQEAEALKAEYEAKAKSADKEAKAMLKRAESDAEAIVAKAADDAEALVARRQAMAEAKIAAEERAAIDEIRSVAAKSATAAAAKLIAERNNPSSDKALVDKAIATL